MSQQETVGWVELFAKPIRRGIDGPVMGIASLHPSYKHGPLHLCLMKVPLLSSATACCSSALVFITIGPYHATGSSIGLPETSRNRMPSSPASHRHLVAAVEQHQRAIAGRARARPSRRSALLFGEHAARIRRVARTCRSPRTHRRRRGARSRPAASCAGRPERRRRGSAARPRCRPPGRACPRSRRRSPAPGCRRRR